MLDVIYIVVVIALFAIVTLVAKGVERLVPPVRRSTARQAMIGEDRR